MEIKGGPKRAKSRPLQCCSVAGPRGGQRDAPTHPRGDVKDVEKAYR
jgi:hypothetical protein